MSEFPNTSGPSKAPIITAIVLAAVVISAAVALVFLGNKINSAPRVPGTDQELNTPTAQITENGPERMESGGAVFGSNVMPLHAGEVSQVRSSGVPEMVVYVDYRCPHCMTFEQSNLSLLEAVMSKGAATVEIRPLTFMDRFSQGSAYSSRAASLFACAVENQPEIAWKVHHLLLSPEVQPQGEGPGYTNEELLQMVNIVTDGTNDQMQSCALNSTYVEFMMQVDQWTPQNPAPGANDQSLRVQSTPTVLVAGELYEGNITDPQELNEFLAANGIIID